jgi:hypothetical protein
MRNLSSGTRDHFIDLVTLLTLECNQGSPSSREKVDSFVLAPIYMRERSFSFFQNDADILKQLG